MRPLGTDERSESDDMAAEERRVHRADFLKACFADIQKAGQARRRALDALYRSEARRIAVHLRATWRMAPDDIAEVTQEVFVKLCRATPSSEQIAFPSAYLMATVRNCVIDHWRRKPPTTEASGLGSDDESVSEVLERLAGATDDSADLAGLRDCVQGVLQELGRSSPEGRLAIDLAVVNEFSGEELAAALGRTHGAARQFLYQVKKKVANLLQQRCADYLPGTAELPP
jgi:RNA polymerase sigma factor (sigma-70 family)